MCIPVDIDLSEQVRELHVAICKALGGTQQPSLLCLFLAHNDSGWVIQPDKTEEFLQPNVVPPPFVMMEPIRTLNSYFEIFIPLPMVIHVLVEILIDITLINPMNNLFLQGILAPLPNLTLLSNTVKYAEECSNLKTWATSKVHELPCIYEFMKNYGGCTSNGKIFWRTEESQIVAILLTAWFKESIKDDLNVLADKKAFLLGSPGVGKSTLMCIVAFYLVCVHKKKVLMYRRITETKTNKCLVYLALNDKDEIVYHAIQNCKDPTAINLYETLWNHYGIENVWLFMDGFIHDKISDGLLTFNLLATSQQVDLKSQVAVHSFCCLLPCWSKQDLALLGQFVYEYNDLDEIEERYYYSGGSVREFTLATIELIETQMNRAILRVKNPTAKYELTTESAEDQVDRLHHSFVKDINVINHFINVINWVQVIESEYAVASLSVRLRSDDLYQIYKWALDAQLQHLAGCAFEAYLHRAMSDNSLALHISEYDSRQDGHVSWVHRPLKDGAALCQGSANEEKYKDYLKLWNVDDNYRYWFPCCHNFPTIDSIVKLKSTSEKKEGIAYLQMTVLNSHDIDANHLKIFNGIFYSEAIKDAGNTAPPIYIVICPNREACESIVLTKPADVKESRKVCQLYVGYFDLFKFDGQYNSIPTESLPPNAPYRFRTGEKRPRES
ncbi:Crinkler (CRN) family protein [Thraustotheca clavata]|uniref:Crinkler (CRN) family protein n=1 Tax=Thraustotheca clavata TaxID=74557 RepID=A0A1W0ABK5_9STRA|nr:Crinkler (CRN) family protein [Thraustotheca clavata]